MHFYVGVQFGGKHLEARRWFAENWYNIVTGLISLFVIIVTGMMVLLENPVPDLWGAIVMAVIGFFFGAQVPRPFAQRMNEISATAQVIKDVQRSTGEHNNVS